MFEWFKKKTQGEVLRLKVKGMHCSSCAINIDNTIEEISGVISSKTNYPKAETQVTFTPGKVNRQAVAKTLKNLGYDLV